MNRHGYTILKGYLLNNDIMSLRVIYLADFEVPSKSASSIHVMRMCEALTQLGYDVTLVAIRSNEMTNAKELLKDYGVLFPFSIRLIYLPRIPGRTFIFACISFFYLLIAAPELVYSRSVPGAALSVIMHQVILEMHRPVWEYGKIYAYLFRRTIRCKHLKRIVLISERLKQIYLTRYPADRYLVAHDAAAGFGPDEAGVKVFERGELRIGYTGGMYKGRGLDLIVKIAEQMPESTFHIAGGTADDLRNVSGAEIPENVYCYGYLKPSCVSGFLKKMDVLIAPYQKDTETIGGTRSADYMSPLKIFEYMSSGKPIVASDLPVLREVLDESCSILVPPQATNCWVAAIKSLKNREKADNLAESAYKKFSENYTWTARAKRILNAQL